MHKHVKTVEEATALAGENFMFSTDTVKPFYPYRPYEVCACGKEAHIWHHTGGVPDVLREFKYIKMYSWCLGNANGAQDQELYELALRWQAEVSPSENRTIEIAHLEKEIGTLIEMVSSGRIDADTCRTMVQERRDVIACVQKEELQANSKETQ